MINFCIDYRLSCILARTTPQNNWVVPFFGAEKNLGMANVTFLMQYGCELSPAESDPTVAIYVSECAFESFVEYEVPVNNPTQTIAVTLPNTAWLKDAPASWPVHTKVVFYATCLRKNEQGTKCRVDAGFGSVNLIDLLDPVAALASGGLGKTGAFIVPLCLNTCNDYEKGRVRILLPSSSQYATIDKTRFAFAGAKPIAAHGGGEVIRLPPRQSNGLYDSRPLRHRITYKDALQEEPVLAVEQECAAYIKKIMEREIAMPNTDKETGNVRVPIYYGDVGMTRRVPLPAAAFMLFRTPRSNLRFWTNTAEVCLARDGRNVHDVMNKRRMDLTQRARLMVEMCCALVQSLDYIGDLFDMNRRFTQRVEGFLAGSPDVAFNPAYVKGCERFGDALRDKTGDCEDLALAIIMVWSALIDAGQAGMFGHSDHAYLREMVRIARQYIPFVTLDSVMAMAIKAREDEGRDKTGKRQLGAHMAVKFINSPIVRECMERTDKQMGTSYARDVPFLPEEPDARDLPLLVGEGTGMFECYGLIIDPISGERSYVYSHLPSLSFAKKPIVHPPHAASSFYVGSMVGLTPYWFRQGYNLGGVWFGYTGHFADPAIGPTDGSIFHRGVKFVEMDNASDRMCIMPHPVFSESLMEWMRVCTKIRVPPRDLILTQRGIASQSDTFAPLDALRLHAKSMGRECTVPHDPAPAYVAEHQMTPAILEGLKREIERSTLITGISYSVEHLTDWAHVYRVGIHANTTEQ